MINKMAVEGIARMSHAFHCIELPVSRQLSGLLKGAFQQLFQMDVLHMLGDADDAALVFFIKVLYGQPPVERVEQGQRFFYDFLKHIPVLVDAFPAYQDNIRIVDAGHIVDGGLDVGTCFAD